MKKLIDRLKGINAVLPAMILSILVMALLGEMVIFLLLPHKVMMAIGYIFGCIYAVFALVHMAYVIEQTAYMNGGSTGKVIAGYLLRLLVMFVVLALLYCLYEDAVPMLAAFTGMLTMKVAAYIWPVTDKLLINIRRKVRKW